MIRNRVISSTAQSVVQAGVVHVHRPARPAPVVPRQLPAAPGPFAGRVRELAALDDASFAVISAIGGAGGIGKTWLALRWAHERLERFPDGQLFVDLRGFSPDGDPVRPAVAVRGFLDALGVDPGRVPVDLDAQAALYRSLVAGRRMLVVLDNAADADQVVPLLPGGSTCTVVVTSRRTLTTLITRHSAHHLPLDVLGDDEARGLMAHRLGPARVATEPGAAAELARLCGGYPLALAIIAGRAIPRPRVPLAEFAAELRQQGLGALDDDDPAASSRAVLSWSHRALGADQRGLFELLATAPGPDIGLAAAAHLADLPVPTTRKLLTDLEEASLLRREAHGRYSMHDLIRGYGADVAAELPPDTRTAALRRIVDHYLHTARAGAELLDPHRIPVRFAPPTRPPDPPADRRAALAWFDTEQACLLAVHREVVDRGWHEVVWQLAWTLTPFRSRRGHHHDDVAAWRAGLAAAEHDPDPVVHAVANRFFGATSLVVGRHDQAVEHLHAALDLAERHDDRTGRAHTHRLLASAWEQRGDFRRAVDHATRALHLHRGADHPVWEANALNQAGMYTAVLGELDRAREHCAAALALHRRIHNPEGEAATLKSLGYIAHHAGQHREALEHYHRALAVYRDLDNTYAEAGTVEFLGDLHLALGQRADARALLLDALAVYRAQQCDDEEERVNGKLAALDDAGAPGQGA
ncbi:ATP-binding protein [Umezawaea sp.]|uniref:ATP-binding protein n=1 Tax=Umezawaea sp. TaxID=1955258 RepID=UPI002ED0B960